MSCASWWINGLKMGNRAVFLDRDNTVIKDDGYFHDPQGIVFMPRAVEGLLELQRAGFLLFIVTNQSGIGRGYFPESDTIAVHERIMELLRHEGVRLEKIYYCPHAPEERCLCRKPKPNLILKAAREFEIDLARSFFIGDHEKDIEAGRAAGLVNVFVGSSKVPAAAEISAADVFEAARLVISYQKERKPLS